MAHIQGGTTVNEPNSGDDVHVDVWWTPDCGYLHFETDPVTVTVHCPDNVHSNEAES